MERRWSVILHRVILGPDSESPLPPQAGEPDMKRGGTLIREVRLRKGLMQMEAIIISTALDLKLRSTY